MAKTFRTVGSGSSQTLHQIEDEKIPIYATKAAADADLANLAVGQIVGTKDGNYNDSTLIDYIDNHTVTNMKNFDGLTLAQMYALSQQTTRIYMGYLAYNDSRNPSYQTYLVTGQPSQNVEVHAGASTVEAYCYDGRYYTYDPTNGWVQKTGLRTVQFTPAAGLDRKTVVTQALGYITDKGHDNDWQIVCIGYLTVLGEFNYVSQSFYGKTSTGDTFTAYWNNSTSTWAIVRWNQSFDSASIGLSSTYFDPGVIEWAQKDGIYTINVSGNVRGSVINPIPADTVVATGLPAELDGQFIWTFGRYTDVRIGFAIINGELVVNETIGPQAAVQQDYWIAGRTTYISR